MCGAYYFNKKWGRNVTFKNNFIVSFFRPRIYIKPVFQSLLNFLFPIHVTTENCLREFFTSVDFPALPK